MLTSAWQRFDSGARKALPMATAFLCCLLSVTAWPLPFLGAVSPPLALIAVYYWTIHRPDLFGPGSAFLIGLINDALNGLPFGLSALLFIAAQQILLQQRRFIAGHSFLALWVGFIIAILSIMITEEILISLIRGQSVPFFPVLIQSLLAVVIFPLPCWLFIRLQRAVLIQG